VLSVHLMCQFLFFFFFQAEDGIRDRTVTGVQTCALPISRQTSLRSPLTEERFGEARCRLWSYSFTALSDCVVTMFRLYLITLWRSEERRVGKECSSGWGSDECRKKENKSVSAWSSTV